MPDIQCGKFKPKGWRSEQGRIATWSATITPAPTGDWKAAVVDEVSQRPGPPVVRPMRTHWRQLHSSRQARRLSVSAACPPRVTARPAIGRGRLKDGLWAHSFRPFGVRPF